MNVPSDNNFPFYLPIASTSPVGSTPGNKTKNIGVILEVSLYVANTSNAGASTYSTPS